MARQINKSLHAEAFDDYLSTQEAKLPVLPDVEHVSSRVIRILGGNPGKFQLQGTNTYILGTGSSRLMVDTGQGMPVWSSRVADVLAAENIQISEVLLTHWHGDHTGGVPDLIRMDPSLSSSIFKNQPDEGQRHIADGQTFFVEGATVKAVFSPGHAHDHMCFMLEEENALFTGDNVLGHGTTAIEDLGTYMDSLRIMQAQNCTLGYPAHGAVITNLPAKMTEYIGQRTRRERQVLQRLKGKREGERIGGLGGKGSATVKEIVVAVHGEGLDDELSEMVLEPFTDEVLSKLAGDGRVGFELSGSAKKWFINE
ncbi:MAG: Atrochrysone carboxyl ACP thioesterase AgnL7 [Piccolia ochrophora]|nr:MAG: Atrochrysone carboxyl ACP thioesterase AgnL7 [Piccolia ochrophora]